MSEQLPERKVILHERFSLCRRNAGYPPALTVLVSYASASSLPSASFLLQRIAELQLHFPLLYSRVVGARTSNPRFQLRPSKWSADDVLRTSTYQAREHDELAEKETLIMAELARMASDDFDNRPLWQVTLFTSETGAGKRAYVALSVDHVLTDGIGIVLLTQALLSPDITALPIEDFSHLASLEETISVVPSWRNTIPIVWNALVLPKLPTFIQNYLRPSPTWPTECAKPPVECPTLLSFQHLPISLIDPIKALGKARGVLTLHPILKIAYLVSLWSLYRDTMPADTFNLFTRTMRSERRTSLNHSYCTMNYVSSVVYDFAASPTDDFWDRARAFSTYMRLDSTITDGRQQMGMLAYVPDPAHHVPTEHAPTGWEEFFLKDATSRKPPHEAVGMSNLGYTTLPPNAEDLMWAQGASPFGGGIGVSLIGHAKGVRISTGFRDGCVVDKVQVKRIEATFERVLQRLLEGKSSLADLTGE